MRPRHFAEEIAHVADQAAEGRAGAFQASHQGGGGNRVSRLLQTSMQQVNAVKLVHGQPDPSARRDPIKSVAEA